MKRLERESLIPRLLYDENIAKNKVNNDDIMPLLELMIAQPSSTAVSQGDFYKNQPNEKKFAKNVGSQIHLPYFLQMDTNKKDEMNKLMLEIVGDLYGGGAVKSGKSLMSVLKNIIGKMKSKRKFPIGHGYPTPRKAHDNINKLINANELQKISKVETSSMIPDMLNKLRQAPDPNLSKIILRNEPKK